MEKMTDMEALAMMVVYSVAIIVGGIILCVYIYCEHKQSRH